MKKYSIAAILLSISLIMTGCSMSDLTGIISRFESAAEDIELPTDIIKNNEEDAVLEEPKEEEIQSSIPEDTEQEFANEFSEEVTEEPVQNATESKYGELVTYTEDELAAIGASQSGLYAYERLNSDEKRLYKQIVLSISNMDGITRIEELDENILDKVFQCVMMDHPEFFWLNGYVQTKFTRGDVLDCIGFNGKYTMDEAEKDRRAEVIETKASSILASAPSGDNYSKIKYIYEYIIQNTEYDLASSDNQNIYSVFANGRSVCQGYAKSTQYLLNKLGIKCTLVYGTSDTGESHAWNLVYSDGAYYYLDSTWGDASYQLAEGSEGKTPSITYDFLCVNDADMSQTHFFNTVVPMPVCSALDDNYFVREGAYFTTVDTNQLANLFAKYSSEGREFVTIKCSDGATYMAMKDYLLNQQHVFSYIPNSNGTVGYFETDKLNSISFWL